MVTKGQKLAEWDPYTIPIITEKDGIAHYIDLIEGISMREVVDEATGISSKVVIDWKQQPRGDDLKPRVTLRDGQGRGVDLGQRARGALLHVGRRHSLGRERRRGQGGRRAGAHPARDPRRPATSPAVCRASRSCSRRAGPRISPSSARSTAGSSSARTTRPSAASSSSPTEEGREPVEYLIPKGKHISVQEGDFVQKGDLLMDGNPVPHDILRVLGRRGAGELSHQRDPGGLSPAGRAHQRQAHRGDRSPDAAEGRDRGSRRDDLSRRRADRPRRVRAGEQQGGAGGPAVRRASIRCCRASPRPACRPTPSSRPPPSRRRPAC